MLFGKKAAPAVIGGATPLFGEKFDLARVLYAYEQLVDALTAKFGNGRSTAKTRYPGLHDGLEWPHPGKEKVSGAWKDWGCSYDVLGEAVVHSVGTIEAAAYMLAHNWTIYDVAKGHLVHTGKPLGTLSATPLVWIYSKSRGTEAIGMTEAMAERVRSVVVSHLAKFGFIYSAQKYSRRPNVTEFFATVTFPHAIYGAGKDWLRVRCVAPDGSEIVKTVGGN